MKITNIFLYAILGALLAGCDPNPPERQAGPQSDPIPVTPELPTAPAPQGEAWSCPAEPGTAPSGELVAERIPEANSGREEFGLYEGPVWLNGALYFSDFSFGEGFPSRIQRLTPDGTMETAIPDSGSNGLAKDNQGYIIAATHDRKAISRYNPYTGIREMIVGEYDGNKFNSPNDLTLTDEGVIYFTDPAFQKSAAPGGQPETRVYRVGRNGVTVVDDSIKNPNGISLSPAQDRLYVAGGGAQGTLRAYPIVDGVPGEGTDIADLSVPDGMAVDCLGNIYATEHGLKRVRVFTPEGEQIATISVDAKITNAAFGGPERKTLYLTGAGAVWSIELDVAGFPY